MASNKTFAVALLLCVVVLSAATVTVGDDSFYSMVDNACFCNCMINECMSKPDATKESCAATCDDNCIKAGHIGRIDDEDFCGY